MPKKARKIVNKRNLDNRLKNLAQRVLKIVSPSPRKPKEADIFLLSDKEMKLLKRRFLPFDKGPANILSFPEPGNWPEPAEKTKKLGEIYLNRDSARGDVRELGRLLVHGLLHLLGYDHKRRSDRMKMEKLEDNLYEILNNTNIRNVK